MVSFIGILMLGLVTTLAILKLAHANRIGELPGGGSHRTRDYIFYTFKQKLNVMVAALWGEPAARQIDLNVFEPTEIQTALSRKNRKRERRAGLHGKPFEVIKFRSMVSDAEKDGARWAAKNDNRVTKLGKFLRKTRIDEIPQAINVLRGEMSFVGPRPERPEFIEVLEKEIPHYNDRHAVKPGITGWAQVEYAYGASVDDARMKLMYDLYYIKNFSIALDCIIVLKTVRVTIFGIGSR